MGEAARGRRYGGGPGRVPNQTKPNQITKPSQTIRAPYTYIAQLYLYHLPRYTIVNVNLLFEVLFKTLKYTVPDGC